VAGTRNNATAGIPLLVSALIIGFASTQPWAKGALNIPGGPLAEVTPNGSLGFDVLLLPDGAGYGDFTPVLLGAAIFLGLLAIALTVTHVPGLGIVWRLLAAVTIVGLGALCAMAWMVVTDPVSAVRDDTSPVDEVLGGLAEAGRSLGLIDIAPGLGLWFLTAGVGIAAVSTFVPAGRRSPDADLSAGGRPTDVMWPVVPRPGPLPPGWYPDQRDASALRWFDGVQWTPLTRSRR
jgi:hypothetical protein